MELNLNHFLDDVIHVFSHTSTTGPFRAMLVILLLSPIGLLCCVGDTMGTGDAFCPVGKPMLTDLLPCISLLFFF
jgi:hypothetical protein